MFKKDLYWIALVFSILTPSVSAQAILVGNGKVSVTDLDFEAEIARIPQEHRAEVLASKARIGKLIESLLVNKTLAAQARKEGLDKIGSINAQINIATEKILASSQMNKIVQKAILPDFEGRANEIYKTNLDKYAVSEKVRVAHILVQLKGRTEAEALERAKMVRDLAISGTSFESLAIEYSDDPSVKSNKGDLGFFEEGRMVKQFSDVAFAMTTSLQISSLVKTNFGYHIIQFIERQPKKTKTFSDVRAEIIKDLTEKHLNEIRKITVAEILSDPSLKLNEDAVNKYQISGGDLKQGELVK
ncbi:MAG: peptidylprolyl isomerase [Pseudomonadota bacterium]